MWIGAGHVTVDGTAATSSSTRTAISSSGLAGHRAYEVARSGPPF